ncbi:hypothetical protein [Streptomyces genisteinicus]|uniref:Uncharacterized protein n=1 Tax=Streptomyces genisteinicus TaxID=2768068 RepID=A0A7H0HLU0_9ACTN|nr:hypothetical protein [Streptomyces genisteinicus]QNP61506.1 hypothetical protein IAG43_00260 [Streptomyces genisteinicus]
MIVTSHPHEAARRRHLAAAEAHEVVRAEVLPEARRRGARAPRVLRLAPADRSLIR